MSAPKGHKKWGGRSKGSFNKKTEQWQVFAEWFMQEGMSRLKEEMSKLEGKEYVSTVKDLLEFFKPKLARQENTHEGEVRVVTGFKFKSNK